MKRFTESFNPGNQLLKTGVTNHYTPVQNILTNIKNLFCLQLGIVATVAEDGFSIKLTSSDFVTQEKVNELLWRSLYNDVFTYGTSSLQGYITSQGLTKVTCINLGGCYIVYFSPEDINAAKSPVNMEPNAKSYTSTGEECGECCPNCCKCPSPVEMKESLYDEFEVNRIVEGDDLTNNDDKSDDNSNDDQNNNDNDDNNNSNQSDTTLDDILNNEDIVKAANQLEIFVTHKINMPRDYYFAAIKFKNEQDEAIALRWKYTQTLPTGNSTENTRSLIHIFLGEEKKIWVHDFAKDSFVELPKDTKTLVENVLKLLGAKKTNDPAIYTLGKESSDNSDKDENDDQNQDDDNQNNDDQNQDNKKDDKNNDIA